MNVTKIDSRTVKTYTIIVEDGEVRDQPCTNSGRRYRVRRITVVKEDGNLSKVELRGLVLKKDGTEGLNDARETLYGQRDWPEWLHSLVRGLA